MELNFSDFSSEFQKKYKEAIKDKQITYDEFKKFSKEDQLKLRSIFDSNPETFNGIDIYTKEYRNEGSVLSLKIGHENDTTGIITINDKIKQKYPLAAYGKLNNGEITLYDKNNKALIDNKGSVVVYKMYEEYIEDLNEPSIVGNFQFIENEPPERTNRRFAVALILSRYDDVISQMQSFLSQLGVLDVGFWREGLGIGIQALADLKDNQETITATTMKKIDRVKAERDQIAADFDKLIDSPAEFETKFYQYFGKDYRDNAISELRDIMHNQDNKDASTKYKECIAKLDELYPDDNIESWEDSIEFQQTVDNIADIVVMFVMTGGIGALFKGSVQKIAMNILKAAAKGDRKAVMMNFAKLSPEVQTIYQSLAKKEFGVAAAQVVTPITQSSATFATWEGLKAFVNGATNAEDLSPEELLSRTLEGIKSGAELGVVMGSLETFAIGPVMKLLTPMINKLSGASSEISNLMKNGNDVVSMDKIMEVYSKTSQTLRGKIAKEGSRAIVSLPAFTVGFTGVDTAVHYDENEFRKLLLDSATSDEERDVINNMDSFALRMKFAEEDFKNQVKGMATIEGVGLIFRRLQAGRIASQALQNDKATNIISANLVKTADNKYEIRTKNGNVLSINDGSKTISSFNSIEEAAAAYSSMCMDLYSEFVASIEEANKNQQTENEGYITELNTDDMPQTNNFKNFMQELKEQHVSFDLYELEDGRKLVRIEDSTKMLTDNRFTYLEYDSEGALSDAYTDISKAEAKNIFTDFANTERRFISNKTRTLNSGLNPEPLMEAGKAHSKLRAVKEEIQNGKKSKKITPEVQERITKIREFLEANQDRPVTMQEIAEHCGISEASANKMVHNKNYGLSDIYISPQQFATRQKVVQIKAVLENAIKNNERVSLAGIAEKTNLTYGAVINLLRPENAEKLGLKELWEQVRKENYKQGEISQEVHERKERELSPEVKERIEKIRAFLEYSYAKNELVSPRQIAEKLGISVDLANKMVTYKPYGLSDIYISPQQFETRQKVVQIKAVLEEAVKNNERVSLAGIAEKTNLTYGAISYFLSPENVEKLGLKELWEQVRKENYKQGEISQEVHERKEKIKAVLEEAISKNEKLSLTEIAKRAGIDRNDVISLVVGENGKRYGLSDLWQQVKKGEPLHKKGELSPEVKERIEKIRAFLEYSYAKNELVSPRQIAEKLGISVDLANKMVTYKPYGLSDIYISPQQFATREAAQRIKAILEDAIKNKERVSLNKIAEKTNLTYGAISYFLRPENAEKLGLKELWEQVRKEHYKQGEISQEVQERTEKIKAVLEEVISKDEKLSLTEIAKRAGIDRNDVISLVAGENGKRYGLSDLWQQVKKGKPLHDKGELAPIEEWVTNRLKRAIKNGETLSISKIAAEAKESFDENVSFETIRTLIYKKENGVRELFDQVKDNYKFDKHKEIAAACRKAAERIVKEASGYGSDESSLLSFEKDYIDYLADRLTELNLNEQTLEVLSNEFAKLPVFGDFLISLISSNGVNKLNIHTNPENIPILFKAYEANPELTERLLTEESPDGNFKFNINNSLYSMIKDGLLTDNLAELAKDSPELVSDILELNKTFGKKGYTTEDIKIITELNKKMPRFVNLLLHQTNKNGTPRFNGVQMQNLIEFYFKYPNIATSLMNEQVTPQGKNKPEFKYTAECIDEVIKTFNEGNADKIKYLKRLLDGGKDAYPTYAVPELPSDVIVQCLRCYGKTENVDPIVGYDTFRFVEYTEEEMQDLAKKAREYIEQSYYTGKDIGIYNIARKIGVSESIVKQLLTSEKYGLSKLFIPNRDTEFKEINQIKSILEDAVQNRQNLSIHDIANKMGVDFAKAAFYLTNASKNGLYELWDKVQKFEEAPKVENEQKVEIDLSSARTSKPEETTGYEFKAPKYGTSAPALRRDANGTYDELFAKGQKMVANFAKNFKNGAKMTEPKIITVGNNHFGFTIDKKSDGTTQVIVKNWLGDKASWEKPAYVEKTFAFELDANGQMTQGTLSWNNYYESKAKTDYSYTFTRSSNGKGVITYREDYFGEDKQEYKTATEAIETTEKWYVPDKNDNNSWNESVEGLETLKYEKNGNNLLNLFLDYARADRGVKSDETQESLKEADVAEKAEATDKDITSSQSSESGEGAKNAGSPQSPTEEGGIRGENTGVNPSNSKITPEMQAKVNKLKAFLQNSYARNKFVSVEDISRELGISTELAADMITNEVYGLSKVYIQEKGFYKQNTANKIKAVLEEALNSGEKITPEQIGEKIGVRAGKIKHYLNPKYAEQYGIKDTVERFLAKFGSPELDNWSLLETHYNTRRMAVVQEAENVQKEVFAQVKTRLHELIENVKPGTKMDERAAITIGNTTVTIFVDKTNPGNTNVTVKNYMGNMKNENHAEVESTMHFRLDESGELQFARINYEEYYPEDDVMKFQYRYIKQPDGQFVIDSKKTYYRDMTYVINQKPLWERTEQYKPASDDLTTWECSSHEGVRPVEDRIEYNPEESGIKNMFFEFFIDAKKENKKTVSDSETSKPVSSPETPIPPQATSSSVPATQEVSSQKYEFKKPDGFVSASLLQEEAYGTKDELFAKGERLLANMIKNLPQNAEIKEPKVITVGNNHFGFTIENTPDGTRLVTVKNWLGDKASWELAAKVEEDLRFELDEDGNMIEGKFCWADADDNTYKAEHSYTFERQTNGDCSVKYQEDVYGQYYYKHTNSPFISEERVYVRSPQNPDAWVAKEDFDELLDGESWLFNLSDGDTSTIEPEFGYDSGEASLMNVFLSYARTNRTKTSDDKEAAPIPTKPAAPVTETPVQTNQNRVSDNTSASGSEANTPEHTKAPLSNVIPPYRKNISPERAKAALTEVKDKIDIEKLKKYIPVDVYKKAVINEFALDSYIDSVIERIVYNSGSLLPETKAFLKDIIKDIVTERVKGVKKPKSNVMSEINAQLDKEFSEIAASVSDKPLQVKDLFGRKEILEIFKAQGLNSGEIATLINTTAPSMRKILSENGVVIDGRKKTQTADAEQKTGEVSEDSGTGKAERAQENTGNTNTSGTASQPAQPKVIDKRTEQSILDKRAKGMSIVQIAMSSNLDVVDVARMLKEEGLLDRNSTEKKLNLAKIIKLYRANIESIEDIARSCGCSAQDVDLALRRVGLRKPRKMPDRNKVAKILYMIRSDYSTPIHKIALEVGESDIYVMQRIAEAGLMTKSQLKPEAAVAFNFEKELLSLYEYGISLSDMQEIFDCPSEELIETLQKYDKMNAKSKLKNPENYEEIRLCKEQGLDAADIAPLVEEDFELVMDVIHEIKVLSGIKTATSTSTAASASATAITTSDSGKTNPSGKAQGGNSSGNVSGGTNSGDAGSNVRPAGTYTLLPEYKEQIDSIIKYIDEFQSVLKNHQNEDIQRFIKLAPDVLSGKRDFKDIENLIINILILQENIQEEIFNYESSNSKYFIDPNNAKYYDNWKENIKGKINLSVEEYYTLRTKYQMTDSQIFYDNDNILDVFGVTNFEELAQFIDSNSSYGGRTTIQSIFKVFGQKNIAGLKQYLKDNNISGFGSSNTSSSYLVKLSFKDRNLELFDNFDYFSKVFHNTHGPITLPAYYETVTWRAINKEFTLKHKFNFVKGIGNDYKGYPKLLSYMGIDYQNCPNIEETLNSVQTSNSEKFITLSRVLNNQKISSKFPTIHGRMRFIERILLKQGVDIEDTNSLNTFLDSFFEDMKNALNQGVTIERYNAVNGSVGAKLNFTLKNGQTISVTINKEGLIHTIY